MNYAVKSALAISLLAVTATAVQAQQRPRVNLNQAPVRSVPASTGISYDYAGLRYVSQNIDDYDCTQDGINVYGSMDVKNGFFAEASFADVSGDGCGSSSFAAGGGYHTPFSQTSDMYFTVGFQSVDVDFGDDDSGLNLAAGLRTFLRPQLEGNVELFHSTLFDAETGISGGLVYWFNNQFSVTGDLIFSADSTTFGFGARMAF
jgi:hypothetical protein